MGKLLGGSAEGGTALAVSGEFLGNLSEGLLLASVGGWVCGISEWLRNNNLFS